MPRLFWSLLLSLILETVLLQSIAWSAHAAGIYWTNPGNATIGHANLDGTGVNNNFMTYYGPSGIDTDGTYLYWTWSGCCSSYDYQHIARSNLDGTGLNNDFINSHAYPSSIAVDGTHIYWGDEFSASTGSLPRPTSIGRANLDGTGANNTFIGGVDPSSIAIDSKYLYWTDFVSNTIGRANLDGTGVNNSFITGAIHPNGLVTDGTYLYWGNTDTSCGYCNFGSIGRANLDGTGVNNNFIHGVYNANDVATDGTYLYWTTRQSTIYRANLDGSAVIPFIYVPQGSGYLEDLAVFVPEPSTGLLMIAGLLGLAASRRTRASAEQLG